MHLQFSDEAFLAVVYLINRTPSSVNYFATPLERLFQTKPDYTSLQIFGCACWPISGATTSASWSSDPKSAYLISRI